MLRVWRPVEFFSRCSRRSCAKTLWKNVVPSLSSLMYTSSTAAQMSFLQPSSAVFQILWSLAQALLMALAFVHLNYCCIFCDPVVPEAKAFGDGKCIAFVVCHVVGFRLHNPYDMMKSISPVIEDGLQDVKELFLQSKKVVAIWLADDGRLGVQSIPEELCNFCWWCHYFWCAGCCPKSTKMMARRTKALANSKLGIFECDGDFRESESTCDSWDALHC